jgi:hypothetical protein
MPKFIDSAGHLPLRRSTGTTVVGDNGGREGSLLYSLLQVRCNKILHLLLQIFMFLSSQPPQIAKDRAQGSSQLAFLVVLQMLKSRFQCCQQGFCQVFEYWSSPRVSIICCNCCVATKIVGNNVPKYAWTSPCNRSNDLAIGAVTLQYSLM